VAWSHQLLEKSARFELLQKNCLDFVLCDPASAINNWTLLYDNFDTCPVLPTASLLTFPYSLQMLPKAEKDSG
jgi:hypothetical protein